MLFVLQLSSLNNQGWAKYLISLTVLPATCRMPHASHAPERSLCALCSVQLVANSNWSLKLRTWGQRAANELESKTLFIHSPHKLCPSCPMQLLQQHCQTMSPCTPVARLTKTFGQSVCVCVCDIRYIYVYIFSTSCGSGGKWQVVALHRRAGHINSVRRATFLI